MGRFFSPILLTKANNYDILSIQVIKGEMFMLKLVKQPTRKSLCGQATIAMIAGITLEESIEHFGHKKSTRYKEYTQVLSKLGVAFNSYKKVDNRRNLELPKTAIIRMHKTGRKGGHLIAYHDGRFYDPIEGIIDTKEELMYLYNKNSNAKWRIDWYMEILGKDNNMDKAGGC